MPQMPTIATAERRERRAEQRYVVVDAVRDQQRHERDQGERANHLRPPPCLCGSGERVVHPLLGEHRAFIVSHLVEHVMAVQRGSQLLGDVMAQQELADFPRQIGVDERSPERLSLLQIADNRGSLSLKIGSVRLDELHRRQHFAVPRRLQKPHVFCIGIEHVHAIHIDPLPGKVLPEMAGDDQVRDDGNRPAISKKEHAAEMRIEVRLHDQVRRLAVGQPYPADRRDGRANHHRLQDRLLRGRCEHEDDHERADGEPDHRHAVENARRKCDDGSYGNDGGKDRAVVAPQQEERNPFEHARLGNYGDEKCQAEDEEHRVGVNQVVEPVKRQHVRAHPGRPARGCYLAMPLRRLEAGERGHDDQGHAVGEGVFVDLVFERAEGKETQDCGEHLDCQERYRQRSGAAESERGRMQQ